MKFERFPVFGANHSAIIEKVKNWKTFQKFGGSIFQVSYLQKKFNDFCKIVFFFNLRVIEAGILSDFDKIV